MVLKKSCLKIVSLSTNNQFEKVGLQFILHSFEVARPVSFSSHWFNLTIIKWGLLKRIQCHTPTVFNHIIHGYCAAGVRIVNAHTIAI